MSLALKHVSSLFPTSLNSFSALTYSTTFNRSALHVDTRGSTREYTNILGFSFTELYKAFYINFFTLCACDACLKETLFTRLEGIRYCSCGLIIHLREHLQLSEFHRHAAHEYETDAHLHAIGL